jgi:hypothetical protein
MAPPSTSDEGPNLVDLERQLLLYKLQRLGLIEAREGGWRLTQHAASGLAKLRRGHTQGFVETQPVNIRPWRPRKLRRGGE